MKMLNQKIEMMKKITFIVLVLLTVPVLHALAGSGPGGLGGEAAPIDGGISLLVAAGVGYGVKKARAARKRANVGAEVENK
jgi:hypothetical protein